MSLYKKYSEKEKGKRTFRNTMIAMFLLILGLTTLFPICYMIISSFSQPIEAGAASYSIIPKNPTLSSYKFFFDFSKYSFRWILNSFIVGASVTVSNVIFASMAGYAFAKLHFPGAKVLFFLIIFAMMVPYQVTQVPLYILVSNVLNLQNTYTALIVPSVVTCYNVFMAKQFIGSIPSALIEAAKIEGCSQFRLYVNIILPLSKTVLAVIAITTFMGNWNNFFWPFLVTTSESMQTIQVGLKNFSFANTTYFAPMMAGATVSALPMFILFFSLQKYFLEGVTIGAVKG